MKKFLPIVFLLVTLCGYSQQKAPIYVSGHLPDSHPAEGHRAYLFVKYGNQGVFLDSTTISGGRFELKGQVPYNEVDAEIIIERMAVSAGPIAVNQGDKITLEYPPIEESRRPIITGSKSYDELQSVENSDIKIIIEKLQERLYVMSAVDRGYKQLKDSLNNNLQKQEALWRELFYNTNIGYNAIEAYQRLRSPQVPLEEQQKMWLHVMTKFRYNINIPKITNGLMGDNKVIPATTAQSRAAFIRYARLLGKTNPYPDFEISEEYHYEVPYVVGNLVEDFALPDADLQDVKLSDITADYVLIVFWSSKSHYFKADIPYLKSMYENFSPSLAIFAISIDENLYTWQDAIAEAGIEEFTHVILRSDNSLQSKLTQLFDAAFVPKSFLLNKTRHLIAMNMPYADLSKKLPKMLKMEQ
jgi:hypothetical protein